MPLRKPESLALCLATAFDGFKIIVILFLIYCSKMINVDPNTFINLSSPLTSIKLNRSISISPYIHLSIRIHLHYGPGVF